MLKLYENKTFAEFKQTVEKINYSDLEEGDRIFLDHHTKRHFNLYEVKSINKYDRIILHLLTPTGKYSNSTHKKAAATKF